MNPPDCGMARGAITPSERCAPADHSHFFLPFRPTANGREPFLLLIPSDESRPVFVFGGKVKPYKKNDPFYTSAAWRAVREQALLRDHYECQQCLKLMEMGKLIRPRKATMVHHIVPRSLRPDLELDLDNLISLCDSCHNKEHPERGFKVTRIEGNQQQRYIRITNERSMDRDVRT